MSQKLIQSEDGKVFLLATNERRWVTSPLLLAGLNPSGAPIAVASKELNALPEGLPIFDLALSEDEDYSPLTAIHRLRVEAIEGMLDDGMRGIEMGAGAYPSEVPDGVSLEHFDRLDRKRVGHPTYL